MRYDMSAVVIERERSGSRYNYHDVRVRHKGMDLEQLDNLPKKQGYRRPHKENGDCKEFSDLLGPLEGFLRSRVGQKWDDVYSEIRERINPNSTVQIHILGHIFGFIYDKTYMGTDGHVWASGSSRFSGSPIRVGYGDIYVHPLSGLVAAMPERKRYYSPGYDGAVKHLRGVFGNDWGSLISNSRWNRDSVIAEAKRHRRIGLEQELHKSNGIWYWAVFSDVPPPLTVEWFDAVAGEKRNRIVRHGVSDYWTGIVRYDGRYRSGRRQANRRDLRRYRLRND